MVKGDLELSKTFKNFITKTFVQTINVFNWLIFGDSNNLIVLVCYFTGMAIEQIEDCFLHYLCDIGIQC